jgi:hypothetical protein
MKRFSQKLKNFLNKRKQKKIKKCSGKKRKILALVVLAATLIFGRSKSDFGKTQNHETPTTLANERVISN